MNVEFSSVAHGGYAARGPDSRPMTALLRQQLGSLKLILIQIRIRHLITYRSRVQRRPNPSRFIEIPLSERGRGSSFRLAASGGRSLPQPTLPDGMSDSCAARCVVDLEVRYASALTESIRGVTMAYDPSIQVVIASSASFDHTDSMQGEELGSPFPAPSAPYAHAPGSGLVYRGRQAAEGAASCGGSCVIAGPLVERRPLL